MLGDWKEGRKGGKIGGKKDGWGREGGTEMSAKTEKRGNLSVSLY